MTYYDSILVLRKHGPTQEQGTEGKVQERGVQNKGTKTKGFVR